MSYSDNINNSNKNFNYCHGCGLCTLVCPAWQQQKDVRVSPQGHAKALQYGGKIKAEALFSCILCGACSAICPENIDLTTMLLDLRQQSEKTPAQQTIENDLLQLIKLKHEQKFSQPPINKTVFLPGPELRSNQSYLSHIMQLLNNRYDIAIAGDDGYDISMALEAGVEIPAHRLDSFLQPIRFSIKLIVSDGLLIQKLHHWLPYTKINSTGYELSQLPQIREHIKDSDFYVIESRAYHCNFEKNVSHYDKLQREQFCQFNLDLNRLAIPTGAVSNEKLRTAECFNTTKQAEWMLSNKQFARIIVEDMKDLALLSKISDKPVLHLAELN
ncbi:MAG: 4Fe-4S dicluster domain-containing protein [Gammaproteobacteria bacterium]|nr:4Fe-4S dicluster domain-containing protein [Gammaproteobacteria bacterium]